MCALRAPPGARKPRGRTPAARSNASVARARQLRFSLRIESAPRLVHPSVHSQLVPASYNLADRIGMVLAVPAFDEERRSNPVTRQQREEVRVAAFQRGVCPLALHAFDEAGTDVCGLAHVVEGEASDGSVGHVGLSPVGLWSLVSGFWFEKIRITNQKPETSN